jgi:hypothetical protein
MLMKILKRFLFSAAALITSTAIAKESVDSMIKAGMDPNCAPFASNVSASEGTWKIESKYGCLGAFQFCPGTFEQYYKGTKATFLATPSHQVKAWTQYERDQWAMVKKFGLDISGREIVFEGVKFTVDHSAILMACQFGCGRYGKLANYIKSGDCNSRKAKDGNGVSVCRYLRLGKKFRVDCFTGEATAVVRNDTVDEEVVSNKEKVKVEETNSAKAQKCATDEQERVSLSYKDYTLSFDHRVPTDDLRRILSILKE